MTRRQSKVKRPTLKRVSLIAGIALAVVTIVTLVLRSSSGTSATGTATGGPVVITQHSPQADVVVNIPPERRKSDQDNCSEHERWVGMSPSTAEWPGQVTTEQAKTAVLHGELRWSPLINQVRQTTVGVVELEIDGQSHVIHRWDSPDRSTYSFNVKLNHLLVGTSGRYKIRWRWEDGSSGVCVAKSQVEA